MRVELPIESWNEIFGFITLPVLGEKISPISNFLHSISIIRILGLQSERTIDKLAIFQEFCGVIEGSKFRKMPMPRTIPPWNVHINSITIYYSIGPQASKFLRLLTSVLPCHLHFDGSHFSQQFGIWPNNVQKVILAKNNEFPSNFHNGRSLFHIFNEQNFLFRLLEVTFIECDLSEPDYNQSLFVWLNHPIGGGHTKSRNMILRGEEPNIQQFLRDARQNFANSIEPANYKIEIKSAEMNTRKWTDKNCRTQEQLIFQKGKNVNEFTLERKSMGKCGREWRELIEFDEEMAGMKKRQNEEETGGNADILDIFFK